jgi:transposase
MSKKVPPKPSNAELHQLPKEELVKLILALQNEVDRLKAIISKDSSTSSKPPSTDIIKKSEKKPSTDSSKETTKRKPGGQPGHQGKTRKGFGRVDRIENLYPKKCSGCGGRNLSSEVIKIETKQVAQLVAKPIEIVEYHRHHHHCQDCGKVCVANWSEQIIPGQDLGVRLQGLIGWLGNYAHVPYEKIQELLCELGSIEIGVGTLVATNQRVASAIKKPVEQLAHWVKKEQPNIHVDETPWTVKGIKEWLWVVANPSFCLFHGGDTRSRAELELLLGKKYSGVISSDDYSVYNGYPAAAQQKCLAHILRKFKGLIKLPGLNNTAIGQAWIELIDEGFKHYHLLQTTGDHLAYQQWVREFQTKLSRAFHHWIPLAGATAKGLLCKLQKQYHQWWYFLEHPEVPPDNNLAERCLRLAVTKRKISGGSRSLSRFGDTADLLSVIQTCRIQQRCVVDFFAQALCAHVGHRIDYPSLIPFSPT